jgi:hypothetical protein
MRTDQALNVAVAALKMIADSQNAGGVAEAASQTRDAAIEVAKLLHVMPGAKLQHIKGSANEYECSACKNIFEYAEEPQEYVNYCQYCGAPIEWGKEPTGLRPMAIDMRMNANAFIKVKLTRRGIDILKQKHARQTILSKGNPLGPFKLLMDDQGYYVAQLWEIMQDFGPHMVQGMNMPFETEIILSNAAIY